MDIQEKQAKWKQERPLFEAAFIHSHLLPFFNFNENTGDYEIKSEYENDEDRALSFNVLNTGWAMWLRAKRDAKAQTIPKWISVEDELPPSDTMVLICWSDSPDVEPEKDFMDVCVDTGCHFWANSLNDEPSHWMHLPEPPKAQEQGHD